MSTAVKFLFAVATILLCISPIAPTRAEGDRYIPFVWNGLELTWGYCDKAALLIPVHFEGDSREFFLQLDTGCEATFVFGNRVRQLGVPIDSGQATIPLNWYEIDHEIGMVNAPVSWFKEFDPPNDTSDARFSSVGTIGSDVLRDFILIIDFPETCYAVFSDTSGDSAQFLGRAQYVDAQIKSSKLFVTVQLGEDSLKSVLFDTGSSDVTLLLPEEEWIHYTGLRGDEPEIKRAFVPSWDQQVQVWRAPAQQALRIGDLSFTSPTLECVEWPTYRSEKFRLIGNALFYDDYTVVLDFKYSRVGLLRNFGR